MSDTSPRGVLYPVIAGLLLGALALRPQILAIGPLLPLIRDDLGLSATVAGLLTAIPVLCMGLFAPFGPRIAHRFGPRLTLAGCLAVIAAAGLVRAIAPGVPWLLVVTVAIGIGIGAAGPVPAMVVARRLPGRPVLGTGAYSGGIVIGSFVAAWVAIPFAGAEGDWRRALLVISVAGIASLVAWLLLVAPDEGTARRAPGRPTRLPWSSPTAWLLILLFGLQSTLYYGIVTWLPNMYFERGWTPVAAGDLLAAFNFVGMITAVGVPIVGDRLGSRRTQLLTAAGLSLAALVGIELVPALPFLWVIVLGLGLGMVFPVVLTLPIDVADDPATVGAVAALMLLGGYMLSSVGPFLLGGVRDLTGDFSATFGLLVVVAVGLVACCALATPGRLHRGMRREPLPSPPV